MSATSDLLSYYRLHPLIVTADNQRFGDLDSRKQLNSFKTWVQNSDPLNPLPVPNRSDTSQPIAVESKRFPNQHFNIRWTGSGRMLEARRAQPYQKNLADFVVLLSAERTVNPNRVYETQRVMRGLHCSTGYSINSGRVATPDAEHVTWQKGRRDDTRTLHGYVIYPKGVPLGSSSADREARWRNQHLTTAEVAFMYDGQEDPALTEPLGREIRAWFAAVYTQPMRAGELGVQFIMVYDLATRRVQLYREGADPALAPEHTFNTPCRLPWEKLGLPQPPMQG